MANDIELIRHDVDLSDPQTIDLLIMRVNELIQTVNAQDRVIKSLCDQHI